MEVEQQHAENHQKWVVGKAEEEEDEEEEEDAVLERRQPRQHREDNFITRMVPSSSSSSSSSSGSIVVGEHSNGTTTNPDGPPVHKEEEVAEMGDVNGNRNRGMGEKMDGAALGLVVVAEFVGTAANGESVTSATVTAESQNQNNVYFDEQEGSEAKNGSSSVQNGDGATESHDEGEFNIPADSGQYVETMDDKCPSNSEISHLHTSSEVKATSVKDFNDDTSTNAGPDLIEEIDERLREPDVEAVLAKQETHDLFCPNCHSCITKRVILRKRKRHVPTLDPKAKRDKFEPLVSSNLVDSPEYKSSQADHAITTSDVGSQESPVDQYNAERDTEVFRCLSCFSFFIASGNGFNMLRSFGSSLKQKTPQNSSDIPASNLQSPSNMLAADLQHPPNLPAANLQRSSNIPTSKPNWFLSLLTLNKGKIASKQGDAALEHSETVPAKQIDSSSITSNMLTSSEIGHPGSLVADTTIIKNGKPVIGIKPENEGLNSLTPSTVVPVKTELLTKEDFKSNTKPEKGSLADQQYLGLIQNDSSSMQSYTQTSGNVTNGIQKVGNNLVDFSEKEHIVTGNAKANEGEKKNDSADIRKTDIVAISPSVNLSGDKLPMHEIDHLVTPVTGETLVNIGKAAEDAILTNNAVINLQTSKADAKIPQVEKVNRDILEEINPAVRKRNQGGDVVVLIEAEADQPTSQSADTVAAEGVTVTETFTQVLTDEQQRTDIGDSRKWKILKSIVYGGLLESIASLGVVSSSVGGGASALNIIALGLANLIGGLFILGHNLIELKSDHSGGDLQQMNTQDRYQELLGRRANFLLHAVVAVLSFLAFGSVPLVVYGFLIHKNYSTEVKLAVVAAASLLCVILLAIGKVYTKRPPKSYIKTVLYYFTMALAASGASYIVGSLIKDLLKKYIDSESGFVLNMAVSGRGSVDPAWMSY